MSWKNFGKVASVLGVGMVFGLGAQAQAQDQYGYDDAYDPGVGYSDPGGGYVEPVPQAPPPPPGPRRRGLFPGGPNFRYGYMEAEYQWMSFSDDLYGNRGAYAGEFSIGGWRNFYLKGSGLYAPGLNDDIEDVSYFYGSFGPGMALPVGGALDITFDGGFAYQGFDTSFNPGIGDGFGFYLTPGVRLGIGNVIELNAALRFLYVGDTSNFGVKLGAHIYLTDNIVIVGSADFGDEIDAFGVGLRINF